MKRIAFFLLYSIAAALLSAAGIDPLTADKLVAEITRVSPPVTKGEYVIFTADSAYRYAGIAFDFENFRTIHTFQRLVSRDENGKEFDSLLFFIAEIPKDVSSINYRMVIDGLWTTDPQNPITAYDNRTGMMLSSLPVTRISEPKTDRTESGTVRFIYQGERGQTIRLAGSFNNWDSFMYELKETSPGFYELDLPQPRGTYYYTFLNGTTALTDTTNPDRGYTKDGRVASILTVN